MLKDRSKLEIILIEIFTNNITNGVGMSTRQQWCLELSEKYNIPIGMSSDYISRRRDLSECNEFVLFAITDVVKPDKIKQYFTQTEIKAYSNQKLELDTVKFPLRFHMIQIAEDQYIGKVTVQEIMRLREAQLINYNKETQRALRVQIKGGEKILRPYVDSQTVSEISDLFASNMFIPNMLTLNINFDDEKADWFYDEDKSTLVIKDITAFDITDGYHRYLAMGRNYDINQDWDYPMMIQITAFPENKARQMIYQENQKTVMKEADVETYNQRSFGNVVTDRINKDPESNFQGSIGLKDGLINASTMATTIDKLWETKSFKQNEAVIRSKDMIKRLNAYATFFTDALTKKWEPYETMIVMYGFREDYTMKKIKEALNNISEKQKATINKQGKLNAKVLGIIKEVYGDA